MAVSATSKAGSQRGHRISSLPPPSSLGLLDTVPLNCGPKLPTRTRGLSVYHQAVGYSSTPSCQETLTSPTPGLQTDFGAPPGSKPIPPVCSRGCGLPHFLLKSFLLLKVVSAPLRTGHQTCPRDVLAMVMWMPWAEGTSHWSEYCRIRNPQSRGNRGIGSTVGNNRASVKGQLASLLTAREAMPAGCLAGCGRGWRDTFHEHHSFKALATS